MGPVDITKLRYMLCCCVLCAMPFLQCCAARTVGEMDAHTWPTAQSGLVRYNCRVVSVID